MNVGRKIFQKRNKKPILLFGRSEYVMCVSHCLSFYWGVLELGACTAASRKRLCDATTGILYIITRSTCPNLSETVFRQPDGGAVAARLLM